MSRFTSAISKNPSSSTSTASSTSSSGVPSDFASSLPTSLPQSSSVDAKGARNPKYATTIGFEAVALAPTMTFTDEEGPSSAPTMYLDLSLPLDLGTPTALPAPPLVPALSTFEPQIPEHAIPLYHRRRPALQVVSTTLHASPSARPTKRMAAGTRLRLVDGMRPSTPPSFPPPGSAPIKRAA